MRYCWVEYPSPRTSEVLQQQEADALSAAVDRVIVVAFEFHSLSPPRADAAWLEALRVGGIQIIFRGGLTHDSMRTLFVHQHIEDSADEQMTLQRSSLSASTFNLHIQFGACCSNQFQGVLQNQSSRARDASWHNHSTRNDSG